MRTNDEYMKAVSWLTQRTLKQFPGLRHDPEEVESAALLAVAQLDHVFSKKKSSDWKSYIYGRGSWYIIRVLHNGSRSWWTTNIGQEKHKHESNKLGDGALSYDMLCSRFECPTIKAERSELVEEARKIAGAGVDRQILEWVYFGGLTLQEVGDKLNVSHQAIHQRLRRVLTRIRKQLKKRVA